MCNGKSVGSKGKPCKKWLEHRFALDNHWMVYMEKFSSWLEIHPNQMNEPIVSTPFFCGGRAWLTAAQGVGDWKISRHIRQQLSPPPCRNPEWSFKAGFQYEMWGKLRFCFGLRATNVGETFCKPHKHLKVGLLPQENQHHFPNHQFSWAMLVLGECKSNVDTVKPLSNNGGPGERN